MRKHLFRWALPFALALCVQPISSGAAEQSSTIILPSQDQQIVVNRILLDEGVVESIRQAYGSVEPGRYWYDDISGLWGLEGGPYMGQLYPGLNLGGPMPSDISGSGTGTFINGREIHALEYQALLAAYGVVYPGNFWLSPDGWLGAEGGPPLVNLAATAQQGAGGGAWSSYSGLGGSVGQDSSGCSYFSGTGSNYSQTWSNC